MIELTGDIVKLLTLPGDGGVQRGTHVLKALSLGAKAVGIGRYYLPWPRPAKPASSGPSACSAQRLSAT